MGGAEDCWSTPYMQGIVPCPVLGGVGQGACPPGKFKIWIL